MYYEIHQSGDSEGLLHSLGALMANPFSPSILSLQEETSK